MQLGRPGKEKTDCNGNATMKSVLLSFIFCGYHANIATPVRKPIASILAVDCLAKVCKNCPTGLVWPLQIVPLKITKVDIHKLSHQGGEQHLAPGQAEGHDRIILGRCILAEACVRGSFWHCIWPRGKGHGIHVC